MPYMKVVSSGTVGSLIYMFCVGTFLLRNPRVVLSFSTQTLSYARNNNNNLPFALMSSRRKSSSTQTAASKDQEANHETNDASVAPNYFLLKSEPHEFSIQQLQQQGRAEEWDGVRNYAARNVLRTMQVGDMCWFYHSSCAAPAIVGTCRVVRGAQPDKTALDPAHANYDPKSTPQNCRWDSVLVEFDSIYETPITLKELRAQAKTNDVIAGMMLLHRSRLSVMPVTMEEWTMVERLMERKANQED